jgi:hypothetical protein
VSECSAVEAVQWRSVNQQATEAEDSLPGNITENTAEE